MNTDIILENDQKTIRLNGTRMNTDYTDKYREGIHKPAPPKKKRDPILSQSDPGFWALNFFINPC
jgi:hypothetical protein